ncbi:MAG: phage tail tape measure protein [Selenomonas sp.]|nr:phage tail tape measure protein [Selenomonas sp.]
MTEKDTFILELQVNGSQAMQELDELRKHVADLQEKKAKAQQTLANIFATDEMKRQAVADLKAINKELKVKERELKENVNRMEALEMVLHRLDKATPKQLRDTIKEIYKMLNSGTVERGSEEWDAYMHAIRAAKTELKKLNKEQEAFEEKDGAIERFRKMGERWVGAVTVVKDSINAVAAVMSTMRTYVDEFAEMQEHMSGVVKYTGLSAEAVDDLNESFKNLDTRTPRAALNDLAADAGRLGIQSKEDVLDFVDAANQITVALGEDLGEDAVKNIGKITQLFATDPSVGLKEGMLATASTINDLAQSSSASEPYLLEFTARMSGMANSAKISQTDILGFASVLDQSMVGVEKGATALQNVLGALFRNPAEMAKIAGLNVKEFSETLKTDANAAVVQFLEALKSHGGMENVAPMLEQMHLSGAGVTQTLTALANNLDLVRAAQTQAAEAYSKGTSVTDEYNKANNTLQAQLEKSEQKFADMRVELGQKLSPIYTALLNGAVSIGRALMPAIGYAARYGVQLTILSAVVGGMIALHKILVIWEQRHLVVQSLNTVATKIAAASRAAWSAATAVATTVQGLFTGAVSLSTLAVRGLNAVMAMSPVGWLMAGLSALLGVVTLLQSRTGDLTDAQRKSNEEQERKARLQREVASATEEANRKTAEEVAKIDQLRRRVENQTLSYQERNKALLELKRLVPEYHASLRKSGKLIDNNTEAIDRYIEKLKDQAYVEALQDKLREAYRRQQDAELVVKRKQRNVQAVKDEMRNHPNQYKSTMVDVYMPSTMGAVSTGQKTEGNTARIVKDKELQTQQDALRGALHRLKETQQDINDLTQLALAARKKGIDPLYLNNDGGAGNGGGGGTHGGGHGSGHGGGKTTNPLLERERKEGAALEKKLDEERKQRVEDLRAQYAAGALSYAEYYASLVAMDTEHLKRKRDWYKLDLAARDKWQKELEKYNEEEKKRRLKWSESEVDRAEKTDLEALELQHERGVMSEREYEDARNQIVLEALQQRAEYAKQWGSAEEIDKAQTAYAEEDHRQQLAREKAYWAKVRELRNEYAKKSPEEQEKMELATLEELHRKKYVSEEEYERLLKGLRAKYAKLRGDEVQRESDALAESARKRLDAERESVSGRDSRKEKDAPNGGGADFGVSALAQAALKMQQDRKVYAHLQQLRESDKEHAKEYDAALRLLDEERLGNLTALSAAAYGSIGSMLSALSAYTQAEGQAEEARVSARYDAEIKAAEGNSEAQKEIEGKKQKELAKIKSEYADRAATMQIAQAVAQTAMAAISAYASAAAVPIVGTVLAPIAAAAAVAAGAVQIATIRKQAEAQRVGYYRGGFTGGDNYRKEAGVVHEGEFVANHQAVRNPSVLRVLRVIDHAQRNNTVARLNLDGAGGVAAAPVAVSSGGGRSEDRSGVASAEALTDTLTRLADTLERGIRSTVSIDGDDGVAHQLQRYNNLRANK